MLDSWFSQLAFSAAAVTVLALVVLLRARDHAHKAAPGGAARWVRAVEVAALVGLGGFGVAAFVGAGPGAAALVAGLLGGSVLGWAHLRRTWRIAAVATWGSGTMAAAAWLVWLAESVVSAASLGPALLLLALAPLVVWGLVSLRGPAQAWLASRGAAGVAGAGHAASGGPGYGRRTLLALAAAVAPALAAAAVVSSVHAPPTPRAGSADTGADGPAGSSGPGAPGSTSSTSGPAETPGPTTASPTDAATTTRGTPGSAASTSSPDPGTTADAATPTTPAPTGTPTVTAPTSTPATTKTPGYEKDKPNRPTDAPSPGGGRPD